MGARSAGALLFCWLCLGNTARARPVSSTGGTRRLSNLEAPEAVDASTIGASDLSNAKQPQSTTVYQEWQGAQDDTLLTVRMDVAMRLTGARFVPFLVEDQQLLIQALQPALAEVGPVELTSFKEGWPDPGEPDGVGDAGRQPFVDVLFSMYWVLNQTSPGSLAKPPGPARFSAKLATQVKAELAANALLAVEEALVEEGLGAPQVIFLDIQTDTFSGGFILHPLVVLHLKLAVTQNSSAGLSPKQVDLVATALKEELTQKKLGTMVDIVRYTHDMGTDGHDNSELDLEVTLYLCKENATVPYPVCEMQLLATVFDTLSKFKDVQQQWADAGIQSLEMVQISERKQQQPSPDAHTEEADALWVPWHLDRIDQRQLPLDANFSASATGAGVNVYIISSGVLGSHEEFGYLDGQSGSRVIPSWGALGADPLMDCTDKVAWYGSGTNQASLCCGLKLGPAKSAAVHSVRFRPECLSDSSMWPKDEFNWLVSALDLALSVYKRPGVILIDAWWDPEQETDLGNESTAKDALVARLDRLMGLNITVVAPAGNVLGYLSPCDNVIAAHPAVVSVAATDVYDQATLFGPRNSTCISLWAPSGGLGTGLIAALPAGPTSYKRVINGALGSAAIVAGVAAQYLELHPEATPAQVLEAMKSLATPDAITGAGDAAPTYLLYTNLREPV